MLYNGSNTKLTSQAYGGATGAGYNSKMILNGDGTGADTPESEEDPGRHPSPPSEPPERSQEPVDQGRQRAAAAVQAMHPPSLLARISSSVTQKSSNIINNVRNLYVVPDWNPQALINV